MSWLKRAAAAAVALLVLSVGGQAEAYNPKAKQIDTDTAAFDQNLSAADNTVQKALETLDELTVGAGSGTITAVGDITTGAAFTVGVPGKTLVFNNATSGSITLQAIAGALGTQTISLPAGTGTLALTTDLHSAVSLSTAADVLLGLSTQQITLDTQDANLVLAGPATGSAAAPTFRSLVDNDIPNNITITETDPNALLSNGTDNVKDTHIDWGTGAGQVSTDDVTQGSTNLYSTLTNIQSALTNDFHNIGGTDATGTDTLDDLSNNSIDDLSDVTIATAAAAHLLVRNVGNSAWENVAMSGDATIAATGAITIASNAVALGNDTTGNYVASATASGGLTLTGTEGGSLGVLLPAASNGLSATTSSGSGLELLSGGLAIIQGCDDGAPLEWNETADTWGCGTDNAGGGTANILDLGDDGGNDSTDLVEIAVTGDTNSVFTEPSADKLLIAVGNDWPKADKADALNANGGNCSANQAAGGVDAEGASESCIAPLLLSGGTLTGDLGIAAGKAIQTGTTAGNTVLLQAYDTDTGPAYTTLATLTAGTSPSLAITGTLTGNASTATALAADPANCASSGLAGGITAAGVAEACVTPNAGTNITADLEEEVTEGSLADSTIVSADIKDAEVAQADINDTATLAGNPAYGDSSVWFATTGLIFEGLLIAADQTGADHTWTLPNETGTICTTGSVCSGYQASGSYLTAVTADSPLSGSGTSGSHLVIANADDDGSTKGVATFADADFDATTGSVTIAAALTRDAEWDTEGEVQTAWGGVNVLLETEIDASAELLGLMDDETGSASGSPLLVFNQSPTIATPILTGKIDRNNVAVDDDDCTGEQGLYWYDTTDSAFEFCNANSGAPAVLGGGAFDSTAVDATTWSDGANASNVWTFDVSGTDHTMTAGNGLMTFSHAVTISGTTTLGVVAGTIDAGGATSLEVPNGTGPTVDAAGEVAVDTTDDQLVYYGAAKRVLPYEKTADFVIENLTASDDNYAFFMKNDAVTITGVGCNCRGTCSTAATFTLEDRGGNAMTITGTNPTCATTGAATYAAVTAGNQLTAGEAAAFDVTNSPTLGDTYVLSVTYTVDAQ